MVFEMIATNLALKRNKKKDNFSNDNSDVSTNKNNNTIQL